MHSSAARSISKLIDSTRMGNMDLLSSAIGSFSSSHEPLDCTASRTLRSVAVTMFYTYQILLLLFPNVVIPKHLTTSQYPHKHIFFIGHILYNRHQHVDVFRMILKLDENILVIIRQRIQTLSRCNDYFPWALVGSSHERSQKCNNVVEAINRFKM